MPVVGQFIPIRRVLKKFFEMPDIFDKTMEYVERLESCNGILSNIVQNPFWAKKCTPHRE